MGKPRWRDLTIGDFLIAERNGGAGGMMGLWDQGGFQRLRIHGYSAMIAAVRPLWNSFASVALPRVGQVLPLGVALRGLKGRVEYGRHFLVGWEGAPPEWEEPFAFDVGRI